MSAVAEPSWIYVLVRGDLPAEQQLVQACHASWHAGSDTEASQAIPSLVALSVPDEAALLAVVETLTAKEIAHNVFFEPDGGVGHTALATAPLTASKHRRIFSGFKLIRWPSLSLQGDGGALMPQS